MAGILAIKIGGKATEDDTVMSSLAGELALRRDAGYKIIFIHGGGALISDLQQHYGVKPCFVDGLRQTSPEEMPLVDMALAGSVNKRLVRLLRKCGLNAWGLCGADAGILTAAVSGAIDENRTAQPETVNPRPIEMLWNGGWLPVFAPPASDRDGNSVNVNADEAALALATALKADSLIFLSDVPGVLEDEKILPHLTPASVEEKITENIIVGGMIPKTRSALGALEKGVGAVIIGNYSNPGDLEALLSGHRGTRIDNEEKA